MGVVRNPLLNIYVVGYGMVRNECFECSEGYFKRWRDVSLISGGALGGSLLFRILIVHNNNIINNN